MVLRATAAVRATALTLIGSLRLRNSRIAFSMRRRISAERCWACRRSPSAQRLRSVIAVSAGVGMADGGLVGAAGKDGQLWSPSGGSCTCNRDTARLVVGQGVYLVV